MNIVELFWWITDKDLTLPIVIFILSLIVFAVGSIPDKIKADKPSAILRPITRKR